MPLSPPTPDLLLARRAAAGKVAAWDEILDRYAQRLFNLALQFAGSIEEAEDLTQEIFLRLFQNLGRYRGEAPLAGWALRLSRNLCIDHYRRTRQERRSTAVPEEVLQRLPALDDPRADAERRQQLRAVYSALEEMPEELAEVAVLRDLQGWSEDETAAYLEMPVGTVKSRLHRARRDLAARVAARQAVQQGTRERSGPAPGAAGVQTGPARATDVETEPAPGAADVRLSPLLAEALQC
ncbi:MAG TPA: sigma-70 family RNA polymerase sigma factor [Thermoanaerobaculia bacterium]|nr:sigma-70 family RNA polymerase sigma factor [Thermoanaerobaculia bacterium]